MPASGLFKGRELLAVPQWNPRNHLPSSFSTHSQVADACMCSLGHPLCYGQFLIIHTPDAEHGHKSHAILYMAVVFQKSPPKSTPNVVSYVVVGLRVNVNAHRFDVATILPMP